MRMMLPWFKKIKATQEEKVNKDRETFIEQINHQPRLQNEESICNLFEGDGRITSECLNIQASEQMMHF